MPMKDWQQRLMGKAMTVTDTKTLLGKDPDKRNPCFTSIALISECSPTCIRSSHIFLSGQ